MACAAGEAGLALLLPIPPLHLSEPQHSGSCICQHHPPPHPVLLEGDKEWPWNYTEAGEIHGGSRGWGTQALEEWIGRWRWSAASEEAVLAGEAALCQQVH